MYPSPPESRTIEYVTHYVYLLRCADGTLYTGYATDLSRRLAEHNGAAAGAGARYTRSRRPVRLVYYETFASRSAAMKREWAIKRLPRAKKEVLCGHCA